MLKTVSSVTNAIGALNYKGTWNASTNTPTITSSVGVKGDYYQVSVAGSTTINGISNWGVGDVIAFNGTTWQRIEGGADLNGVNLSVSGTTTLSGLTASTALALNAGKDVVSVTNTGTDNNVLSTSPSITTPRVITSINDTNGNELIGITATASAVNEITVANAATGNNPVISATGTDTNIGITLTPKGTGNAVLTSGNLVVADGNGIDFSATSGTGTSELFSDYEEGNWTPAWSVSGGTITANVNTSGKYVKIGRVVYIWGYISYQSHTGTPTGALSVTGLPFAAGQIYGQQNYGGFLMHWTNSWTSNPPVVGNIVAGALSAIGLQRLGTTGIVNVDFADMNTGSNLSQTGFFGQYQVA
jgi:hypothetical protein